MPSIAGMIDLISQVESPYVTVHQDRCVLVRNRNADCLRCASVCTSGCIHFEEAAGELVITPDKCIGCGTCATNCPTCCLEAHHPNDAELFYKCAASLEANGEDGASMVVVGCAELLERARGRYDEDKVVYVECLGRMEESMLTALAARGAEKVVLVHGACDSCEHATGRAMCEQVVETEHALLATWGSEAEVRISAKLPKSTRRTEPAEFDRGKRDVLTAMGREGARAGATVTEYAVRDAMDDLPQATRHAYVKTMDDGTLPHFLPDRRERLLDALAHLGQPEEGVLATRLWGHVGIDVEKCESCQMCAVFCPTGALRKFGESGSEDEPFGVEHYPGDCVKCRCCANICPAGALTLYEDVNTADMFAGMTDRYAMRPPKVKKSGAHTIWKTMQNFMNIDEIYER